jgi:hypothetical protein
MNWFNGVRRALEFLARLLFPNLVEPQSKSEREARDLQTLIELVLLVVVGLLALGAWLTGLVPPGTPRHP